MRRFYSRFYLAFTLLTRIPLPFSRRVDMSQENLAGSAAFYPLVGLFFGAILAVAVALGRIGQPGAEPMALILMAIPYLLNRFLHFDGLCDVLDAFLADKPPAERLRILKDSHLGSFALGGAFLLLLLRYILLLRLQAFPLLLPAMVLMPVVSRFAIVALACFSKYPRSAGLGLSLVGRISAATLASAALLFFSCLAAVLGIHEEIGFRPVLFSLAACALWIFFFRRICQRKIGGVTGDCLGALAETVELCFLSAVLLTAGKVD